MAYKLRYAEINSESFVQAKADEREILKKSIDLLRNASQSGADPILAIEALHFSSRVWAAFLSDLVKPENQLPPQVRASLISVGISILKQIDLSRSEDIREFNEIIEVTEIIMDGLK